MDKYDRIIKLHNVLSARRTPISFQDLLLKLECSAPTLKRAIRYLREQHNAPLLLDRSRGYYYDRSEKLTFELPGLWFNAAELQALLLMQRLLATTAPGVLSEELAPIRHRIDRLLADRRITGGEIGNRVRILAMANRTFNSAHFRIVADTLIARRRLCLSYHARSDDRTTERNVSPQRFTHYRDNWYLDAWCHTRDDLRSFALDRILSARQLEDGARDIPEHDLDAHYASSYGIFAGKSDKIAVLRFTPEHARWVADEIWHPNQEGRTLDNGGYELRIPYRNDQELIMDILRQGPGVEVVTPMELRQAVAARLQQAIAQYL